MILSAFCRRTQNLRSLRACIGKAVQRSQGRELEGKRVLTGKVILSILPGDCFSLCSLQCNGPICSLAAKNWVEPQPPQGSNRGIRRIRGKKWSGFPCLLSRIPRFPRLRPSLAAESVSAPLRYDALKLDLGVVPKVDEQAELEASRLEIILNLGAVLFDQFRHCFELQNDFAITDKVRLIRFS